MHKSILILPALTLVACASSDRKKLGSSEFQVEVSYYSAKPGTPAEKTLLILPPTGGSTYLDRSFAKKFRARGFDVFIIEKWTGMNEEAIDLGLHQRLYERGQRALGVVLEQVGSKFVGLMGTSVGGTHAAVAAARQDRLDAIFSIAGGAPIVDIIVDSDHASMRNLREKRRQKFGYKTDDDYRSALRSAFQLEPMEIGEGYKKKALGMAIGTEDTTVPADYQLRLREFWSPELVLEQPNAHLWTIIKTWAFKDVEILGFFEKHAAVKVGG